MGKNGDKKLQVSTQNPHGFFSCAPEAKISVEISISVDKFDVGICLWHILYWITQPLKISVEVLGDHPTGSNFRGKNRMRYVYLWSEWWVSYALAWSCSAPQTWTTTGAFLVFTSIFAVDTFGRKLGTNTTRWIFVKGALLCSKKKKPPYVLFFKGGGISHSLRFQLGLATKVFHLTPEMVSFTPFHRGFLPMQLHRKGGRSARSRRRGPAACDECDELIWGGLKLVRRFWPKKTSWGLLSGMCLFVGGIVWCIYIFV